MYNLETHIPQWEWYNIAMYFYLGGVSAGAYFIASLIELVGSKKYQDISRIGYGVAFWTILATPILLTADLGRPERFWHLFIYIKDGVPYINWQSPMSVGSWALLAYGGFATLSYFDILVCDGRLKWAPFAKFYNRVPCRVYAAIGSAMGFFVAGYTGVLLNISARPLWEATSPFLGALFLVSGGSTGAAAIGLIMASKNMLKSGTFVQLERFDKISMSMELLLIVAMIAVAGQYAAPLLKGMYAIMFWGGTVLLGILIPFVLYWYAARPGVNRSRVVVLTAVLVLIGGAFLRIALVQAGQI
jgi:protein NrfD